MQIDDIKQMGRDYMVKVVGNYVSNIDPEEVVNKLREHNETFDNTLSQIEKAMGMAGEAIDVAEGLQKGDKQLLGIKSATVMVFALYSKQMGGKNVGGLDNDDWKDIGNMLKEYVVMMDPREYTILVFDTYRRSIAFARKEMQLNASPSSLARLDEIVAELDNLKASLLEAEINEATYVEECLWICLEAVIIVLTDRFGLGGRQELANAVGALMFQTFKYKIYSDELAAVDECLKYQQELDVELAAKLDALMEQYQAELDKFDELVELAFNEDAHIAFEGSYKLAQHVGVDESELLTSMEDIEAFFL